MRDWTALSEDEIKNIEAKIVAALNSIGIKVAKARWNMPVPLPHWQLMIETPWCASMSRNDVDRALEQAMARADIQVRIPGQGDRDSEDIPIRIPKLI
jgi:hypothetical protein